MFDWENDQVLLWLKNCHYSDDVLECFRAHKITGLTLPMLNTQDLRDMGIDNLKLRLVIMNQISELLVSRDIQSINVNVEHPLISELQSLVVSTDLVNSVAKSIALDTAHSENHLIMAQFNKLKEDILPIVKGMKNKKPLPSPSSQFRENINPLDLHQQTRLHKSSSSNNMKKQSPRSSNINRSSALPSNETLKQLRAKTDDPCYKILQSAMKSHNLNKSDWKKYVLVICYGGDKERVLHYDEKPVVVFKELHDLGLNPNMMLRQVDINATNDGFDDTPGGRL